MFMKWHVTLRKYAFENAYARTDISVGTLYMYVYDFPVMEQVNLYMSLM